MKSRMDRRSFLEAAGTALAALGLKSLPAWAATGEQGASAPLAAPVTAQAPPAPATGGHLTHAQLKEQILEDVRELGHFRLFYLAAHADPARSYLVEVNTATTRTKQVIDVGIAKRHGIVLSPNGEFALLPELDGENASLVSLKEGKELAVIKPSAPGFFSGHAAFARDGKTVFLPEFPKNEGDAHGTVVARRVPSLEVVKAHDTGAFRPHNLLFSHDGTKLIVGHYGRSRHEHEPPSDGGLALLEASTGKRLPAATPENPYLALCHLDRDDHDNVFISTRSWSGKDVQLMTPILFGGVHAGNWESRLPEELKERFRFNFSIKLAPKAGVLGVAHIDGRMASFWDARKRAYLGMLDFGQDHPLGMEVTPDGRYFLVNTTGGLLYFVDVKTRQVAKKTGLIGIGFCPHISVLPV
jgi:hypothetical protein